jgi:hypothetical protein
MSLQRSPYTGEAGPAVHGLWRRNLVTCLADDATRPAWIGRAALHQRGIASGGPRTWKGKVLQAIQRGQVRQLPVYVIPDNQPREPDSGDPAWPRHIRIKPHSVRNTSSSVLRSSINSHARPKS